MKDALIRAARTFAQAFIATYLAAGLTEFDDVANVSTLELAAVAGLAAVLSFLQNWLESQTSVTYNRG